MVKSGGETEGERGKQMQTYRPERSLKRGRPISWNASTYVMLGRQTKEERRAESAVIRGALSRARAELLGAAEMVCGEEEAALSADVHGILIWP